MDWMNEETTAYSFSSMLVMTLPSPRYLYYEEQSFDTIQNNVLEVTNKISNKLGFYPLGTNFDLLGQMSKLSFAVLFIGLIFDILLIMFIIVAILLIYSLLMISVETKTFEIGVMRLVGLSKSGFIAMIFTQAGMFVFPAVILGFGCSLPCIFLIYDLLFTSDLGFTPSIVPKTGAILQALAIGLLIPTMSAIIPIRRAIAVSLNDALNTNRKKSDVHVSFTDSKKLDLLPYILFGSIAVGYGLTIYLVLPLSLLKGNYTMIL